MKYRWSNLMVLALVCGLLVGFLSLGVSANKYKEGEITIAMGAEPRGIMPNAASGTWESAITGLIFDGMVAGARAKVGENKPGLAKSWDLNREKLTYTFHLRKGVKFHDGQELTAEDVLFSFKCWMNPDYPGVRFSNFENIVGAKAYHNGETEWPIEGIWAPDKYTVKIQLTQVQATFLSYAAGSGIMPKHVYKPYFEKNGYDKLLGASISMGKAVGTGTFKLANWKTGESIKVVANENYWGARVHEEEPWIPSVPKMKTIHFVIIPDTQAQFQALKAGDVDATGLTVNQYWQAKELDDVKAWNYPYLSYDYLCFNMDPKKTKLFKSEKVRRAISWTINRKKLVDEVLQGLGRVANGPTSPLRWDYTEEAVADHPGYNVDKTKKLMEKAGWKIKKDKKGNIKPGAVWKKDGMKMKFEIVTNYPNPRRQDFATLIQGQLFEAGFQTTIRILDTNAFYYDYLMGKHDYEVAIAGWRMGSDPDQTSIFHSKSYPDSFNWVKYQNPKVDKLLEKGLSYFSHEKRKPIYTKISKILVQEQPYVWLAFQDGTFGSDPRLKGFEPTHPQGWYINIPFWYWGEEG